MEAARERRRLGVWLIGARGTISTCVVYGLSGLRQGLLAPVGITTAHEPLCRLPLRSESDLVLGGHEVSRGDLGRSAGDLVRHGVLRSDLVAAAAGDAASYEARIRPGLLDAADVGGADLDPRSVSLSAASPRDQVERLREDLEAFRRENDLERVVVVELASCEAWREAAPGLEDLASLERALDAGAELPASCLYAYAALDAGAPFVNFTPNPGSAPAALCELALERGVPHCGNDGKTGETLVKTALAPAFAARALRVLAWQGYNMLGNRDGRSLAEAGRREAKRRGKEAVLESILGPDPSRHVGVGIDYVPPLHDWKTAIDLVSFEGFLGARMSLQFTWTGSDSALAAPLVIDLVRLADFAAERGETGPMAHTACYFKSPLAGGPQDFHEQIRRLAAYVERHAPA